MERLLVDTNPEQQGQTQPAARVRFSWSLLAIVALLAIAALLPRVLDLADFATTDEVYHWIARTERFAGAVASQRWAETNQTGHPGVTLMWLGSLGLTLERFAVGQGWAGVHTAVEHLAWLRLPAALLQALLVPAGYLLLRRLLAPTTALIAALLWATAPYLIAHARLLHLDALLTSFVTFSLLLLLVAIEQRTQNKEQHGGRHVLVLGSWFSVLASGVCAGLALLTKGPALILLPFIGLLLFVARSRRPEQGRSLRPASDRRWSVVCGLWSVAAYASPCRSTCSGSAWRCWSLSRFGPHCGPIQRTRWALILRRSSRTAGAQTAMASFSLAAPSVTPARCFTLSSTCSA